MTVITTCVVRSRKIIDLNSAVIIITIKPPPHEVQARLCAMALSFRLSVRSSFVRRSVAKTWQFRAMVSINDE